MAPNLKNRLTVVNTAQFTPFEKSTVLRKMSSAQYTIPINTGINCPIRPGGANNRDCGLCGYVSASNTPHRVAPAHCRAPINNGLVVVPIEGTNPSRLMSELAARGLAPQSLNVTDNLRGRSATTGKSTSRRISIPVAPAAGGVYSDAAVQQVAQMLQESIQARMAGGQGGSPRAQPAGQAGAQSGPRAQSAGQDAISRALAAARGQQGSGQASVAQPVAAAAAQAAGAAADDSKRQGRSATRQEVARESKAIATVATAASVASTSSGDAVTPAEVADAVMAITEQGGASGLAVLSTGTPQEQSAAATALTTVARNPEAAAAVASFLNLDLLENPFVASTAAPTTAPATRSRTTQERKSMRAPIGESFRRQDAQAARGVARDLTVSQRRTRTSGGTAAPGTAPAGSTGKSKGDMVPSRFVPPTGYPPLDLGFFGASGTAPASPRTRTSLGQGRSENAPLDPLGPLAGPASPRRVGLGAGGSLGSPRAGTTAVTTAAAPMDVTDEKFDPFSYDRWGRDYYEDDEGDEDEYEGDEYEEDERDHRVGDLLSELMAYRYQ